MTYVNQEQVRERLYSTTRNRYGLLITIIEYTNANNIVVQFEDGYKMKTTYEKFKRGALKSPYTPTICGIGYMGEGPYTAQDNGNSKPAYDSWRQMLLRCYDPEILKRFPSNIGSTVHPAWHNYQVFAKWYDDNYYSIPGHKMELDKDLLKKGNKEYGPTTCVFIPGNIAMVVKRKHKSVGGLPIGVIKANTTVPRYRARFKGVIIEGTFDTVKDALAAYNAVKISYIRGLASEYEAMIPQTLYKALKYYSAD